jgi:hypothetical protein
MAVTHKEGVCHWKDRLRHSIDDSSKLGDLSRQAKNAKCASWLEDIKRTKIREGEERKANDNDVEKVPIIPATPHVARSCLGDNRGQTQEC